MRFGGADGGVCWTRLDALEHVARLPGRGATRAQTSQQAPSAAAWLTADRGQRNGDIDAPADTAMLKWLALRLLRLAYGREACIEFVIRQMAEETRKRLKKSSANTDA